jgi:hypothetical protein
MAGKISAEEMYDVSKNQADILAKVHRLGRTIGRTELDDEDAQDSEGQSTKPQANKPNA